MINVYITYIDIFICKVYRIMTRVLHWLGVQFCSNLNSQDMKKTIDLGKCYAIMTNPKKLNLSGNLLA